MFNDNRKINYYLRAAINASSLSYSKKRKVGCVIVKDNRIIVDGRNGTLPGTDNKCEYRAIKCKECNDYIEIENLFNNEDKHEAKLKLTCDYGHANIYNENEIKEFSKYITLDTVIHAEENAILYASRKGISLEDSVIYCTCSPCIHCSNMIYAAGIKKVIAIEKYDDSRGLDMLVSLGVEVIVLDINMCDLKYSVIDIV